MMLSDLPRFLFGDRAAIERLARSRVPLVIGPFLVLSASLARNYDGAALPQEWTMLTHGLVASVVNALLLYSLVRLASHRSYAAPPFWKGLASFVGLFWLTAPMALVYAIPYERFLEPVEAIKANLWTLAAISVWRVLLIARVLGVLSGVRIWCPLFITLFYSDVIVFIGAVLMKAPVVDFMGGMQQAPHEELLAEVKFATGFWSMAAGLPLLIAAAIAKSKFSPAWISVDLASPTLRPSWKVTTFALVLLVIWVAPLAITQPEQHLRYRADSLILQGKAPEALRLLDAHERHDFPPLWDPEPRLAYGGDHDKAINGITDAFIAQIPTKAWVRELVLDKMLVRVKRQVGHHNFEYSTQVMAKSPEHYPEALSPATERLVHLLLTHDNELNESDRTSLGYLATAFENLQKPKPDSPD